MKLETSLTSSGFLDTTALSTATDFDEEVGGVQYQPSVLESWADELSDVDGRIEVTIQEADHRGSDEPVLALVGRVLNHDGEPTDVVAFAAPLLPNDEDEDDGGDSE